MKRGKLVLKLEVDRRAGVLILAAVVVGAAALRLSSETLTLSTTYPAPVGVYNQIITTGDAGTVPANTVLARSAGAVLLVPPSNAGGMVGIGTDSPGAKLDVAGTIRAGRFPTDPNGGAEGAFYFNTARAQLRVFANGSWKDVAGGVPGSFCGFAPTGGSAGGGRGGGSLPSLPCQDRELSRGCPEGFAMVGLGVGTTCVKQ